MSDARALHDAIVAALALPASCWVDKRVPKKMLAEHGGAAVADRRLLTEGIEEAHWLAAIKPATAAVPVWQDEVRAYMEVAVCSVQVRASHAQTAQTQRLTELIHRAIPYPLLMAVLTPGAVVLSVAHKRAAQNEAGKVVLDGEIVSLAVQADGPAPVALLAALPLDRQPHAHLLALYQGWVDCLMAAQAERVTGRFTLAASPEQAEARRTALREYHRLVQEAARLQGLAEKESQIAKRVAYNLDLQQVLAELRATKEFLAT